MPTASQMPVRSGYFGRSSLTKAGAIKTLFQRFDATLRQAGYIAMSGQIVDASSDYDRAIEDLDAAIRMDPAYASAYANRAAIYEKRVNLPVLLRISTKLFGLVLRRHRYGTSDAGPMQ